MLPLQDGAPTTLSSVAFSTEDSYYYDYLTVDGVRYYGPNGPNGVTVTSASTIQWRSDFTVVLPGWHICLDQEASTSSIGNCTGRGARYFVTPLPFLEEIETALNIVYLAGTGIGALVVLGGVGTLIFLLIRRP